MLPRNDASRSARAGVIPRRPQQRARSAARWGLVVALAWVCAWSHPHVASARGATPVAKLAADLTSGDTAKAEAALDALGERGGRDAVTALAQFVRAGQTDALTDRALTALGAARSPEALDALAAMTRHRRAAARVAAFASIARIGGERANTLLAGGLRDSDSAVRGSCARSLGERRARTQIEPLFRAFERGVPEAAIAVGRLANSAELARFHARLGQAPIQNMLGGYEQLLVRTDVDEATKLDIIARLGEVASLSVKRFLERMQSEHDWSAQLRVQRSLADTARRIDERPKATGAAP